MVSLKLRKVDREGEGIADWWVLGTRLLGMALCKPLDDAGMIQDRHENGGTQCKTVAHWPCLGGREPASAVLTVLHADLYIFQSVNFTI